MSQDNDTRRNQRQVAREQLITAMLEGHTFQEVSQGSDPPLKRAMAYRLLHAVRTQGESALHPTNWSKSQEGLKKSCVHRILLT